MNKRYLCSGIIAAQATPPGIGAISVIRVSGQGSLGTVINFFSKRFEKVPLNKVSSINPRRMYHGFWKNEIGDIIDEVQIVYYKQPYSFTGEEMVEIFTHGGLLPAQLILDTLIKAGIRPAEPGEFSLRAFLNKKIDLVGAQTIDSLIHSSSPALESILATQLYHKNEFPISILRNRLLSLSASIEVAFDYPEDHYEEAPETLIKGGTAIADELDTLVDKALKTEKLRQGLKVVICGRPNVGKSTLLNLFLGEERAIVSDIPGTTRDYISEPFLFQGIYIHLIDTAGLRTTRDKVEKIGVDKTLSLIESADLLLYVFDPFIKFDEEEALLLQRIKNKLKIVLVNKIDAFPDHSISTGVSIENANILSLKSALQANDPVFFISALSGKGLEPLREAMKATLEDVCRVDQESIWIPPSQAALLKKASTVLRNGLKRFEEKALYEIIGQDIRETIELLDEITGRAYDEDILHTIFSTFCVGK
jgi:tRNA modification GTPase